ncbi:MULTISPECIES: hypothetical protein [Hyphobacterium]|uniref:DUF2852 domain-containing protein n=1 Tax=Hyphobacterium vulgare TaxID=1736751 RepID=A0ABV6ZU44_9PROT
MYRLLAGAAAGFVLGVFALLFVGVPFFVPSWLTLRDRVQTREAAAAGHAEAFDESEGLRSDEGREAIGNVEGERGACTERLTEMRRVYERQIDRLLERSDDASCPDPRGVRRIERVPDNTAAVGAPE